MEMEQTHLKEFKYSDILPPCTLPGKTNNQRTKQQQQKLEKMQRLEEMNSKKQLT